MRNGSWTMPLITVGLNLRARGLSYEAIAVVLSEYHGIHVTGNAVRRRLRHHGAAPKPHGNPGHLRRGTA